MSPILDAAHAYAQRGWRIIPLHRVDGELRTCSCRDGARCKSGGKHPMRKEWQTAPKMSGADIQETWSTTRPPNLGIATGTDSGFWVLDIDPKNGGDESFKRLQNGQPSLPETRIVKTGGGGWQLYWALPDFEFGNSDKALRLAGYPGIDIRSNGGQVVAPPSVSTFGEYTTLADPPELPRAPKYIEDLLRPPAPAPIITTDVIPNTESLPETERERLRVYVQTVVTREIERLRSAEEGNRNNTLYHVSCTLLELANSPWNSYRKEDAWAAVKENAPQGDDFTVKEAAVCFKSAMTKVGRKVRPVPENNNIDIMDDAVAENPVQEPTTGGGRDWLDVSNSALMADWLQIHLGKGALSNMFRRGDEIVHVPRIDETGYRAISDDERDHDGPAQIRALREQGIAAQVHYRYKTFEWKQKEGKAVKVRTLFPTAAASMAVHGVEHMTNLRTLGGVVHSTTVRPDGTLITTPGYDESTRLLYLPTPGLFVPDIPETPTAHDVTRARAMILYMLGDFAFVTPQDRANYIGVMLTPLLRNVVPAPFKMTLIEAHQPGSGKTFLARALMTIHGGVFRSEIPPDEPEMKKVITSILDVTTGPVIVFDNATGILRSSTLAGLLTSGSWEERRLGQNAMVRAKNDRCWVVTGNNLSVSGDLARRTLRVHLDPGVPRPELRTEFTIPDFEHWMTGHRGELLWALLILVRNWFATGRKPGGTRGKDSYGVWGTAVEGILDAAGFTDDSVGRFDDPKVARESVGAEDDDWGAFLETIHNHLGEQPWTAKELLARVNESTFILADTATAVGLGKPIPYDELPHELVSKRRSNDGIGSLAKSFGWWLRNREGRWANDYTIKKDGSSLKTTRWKVVKYVKP